ncbi:MAG: hypothetical protein KZQ96_11590 [Candidatus Thiodiazotropha sp. (ex Lucinoma borealis)]|nr:hypothetical protein [Candidatus Thiodiazotropha sp. (ex Lucinoma borealis)]
MKKRDKKQKKKLKKKEKLKASGALGQEPSIEDLKQKINKLESELKRRERKINDLRGQIKEVENKKSKKGKKGKKEKRQNRGEGATKLLLAQQSTRVGIAHRDAWRQHGFLRHRYEYHMESGKEKTTARHLADKDLREKFGEDAGYSEEELEHILS